MDITWKFSLLLFLLLIQYKHNVHENVQKKCYASRIESYEIYFIGTKRRDEEKTTTKTTMTIIAYEYTTTQHKIDMYVHSQHSIIIC